MRIAVVGGGIAGLTATWQIKQLATEAAGAGRQLDVTLFESSNRLGGIIQTVREGDFVIETGPDAWLTQKTWATELATEVGLGDQLIASNDSSRKTWIYLRTPEHPSPQLVPMPDGMTMMVPSDLDALDHSPLFSKEAVTAYRSEVVRADELRASIPQEDESVASFVLRHFGPEVLDRVAAPLLSGVFGGDVHALSARAALPALVELERKYGSVIKGLQDQKTNRQALAGNQESSKPHQTSLFTTLRSGVATMVDRLTAELPREWIRQNATVISLQHTAQAEGSWHLTSSSGGRRTTESFDRVLLALPPQTARQLLSPVDQVAADLIPAQTSSAVLVAYAFADAARVPVPPGFGLLVPPVDVPNGAETRSLLQACTFVDQKFNDRVPAGGRLLRAFFGGEAANRLAKCNNDEIATIGRIELARVLHTYTHGAAPLSGPAPRPLPESLITIVRRLPNSLPQYEVGHLDRVQKLNEQLRSNMPGLALLGNSLAGLGIPDVIREARAAARTIVTGRN